MIHRRESPVTNRTPQAYRSLGVVTCRKPTSTDRLQSDKDCGRRHADIYESHRFAGATNPGSFHGVRHPKRVLFVERNLRNEKLGVMYLSAALKARGHHADLIQTDKEDLDARVRDLRPDFVAFSITTGEHVGALQTAREIKRRHGIANLFGGPHCTYFPEIGFEADVDFVVQGQGEHAVVDIVEGRVSPGFHKAPMVEHLDALPHPDREIFYQYPEFRDNPMKNVITSRACPYKCSYCFNHSQLALTKVDHETKQWFDRRSVADVTTEIRLLQQRYPLDKVLFIDDSFIQSRAWLHNFLDGYTQDVRLPWMCSLRVNCLDEALAEKMFRSGLEMVNYAMESADPDVQQRLLHRGHISNADVIRSIALFARYGIRARMQNMIGLPLTNPLEDALNTLQFNLRHRVTDSWCSIFQPYPRTALGQYCVDHGFTTPDQLRHCSESFFDESRLDIADKNELYALQKLWYFIIDGQLPLDLVQILIRGKFTPRIGNDLQKLRFQCSRKKLYGLSDANPATAVDLRSRERWAVQPAGDEAGAAGSAALVRAALRDTPLPDRFVELLTTVEFTDAPCSALLRYAAGERVYPSPLYTIDDASGELADPAVSIYRRGTPNADQHDIRTMPEEHFMRGMAEVRAQLTQNRGHGAPVPSDGKETVLEGLRDARVPLLVLDSDPAPEIAFDAERDERHLNQYLA